MAHIPPGVPTAPHHPAQLPSPRRLQGKPALQLPLAGSHPYDHITVESAFDNPTYETGVSTDPRGPWPGLGTPGTLHHTGHVYQGLCVGWDTREMQSYMPGTMHGMGRASRDHTQDGHPSRDYT